jgi:hypothetical protein
MQGRLPRLVVEVQDEDSRGARVDTTESALAAEVREEDAKPGSAPVAIPAIATGPESPPRRHVSRDLRQEPLEEELEPALTEVETPLPQKLVELTLAPSLGRRVDTEALEPRNRDCGHTPPVR